MYTDKGYIYSDAGKALVSYNFIGYNVRENSFDINEFHEEDINIDDMVIKDGLIKYNNNTIVQSFNKKYSYADWKTKIIKWRYSNDDQIALLINKDNSEEDSIKYERMQAWREYAAKLAKKILSVAG